MSKKICGIYKITNTINNKVYIGQSIDVKWRWYSHKCELRHGRHGNSHLQYAWSLYGEDAFNFEVLEECPKEDLNIREQYYIDLYDSYNNDKGYNLTLGGGGTVTANEVLQFDPYGNLVAEYRNGIEASEKTGINCGAIYQCCNRRLKKADLYFFVFKTEYENGCDMSYWLESTRNAPVEQYDLYGNLIKVWNSCAEVINTLGFNPTGCTLHYDSRKSDHGFIWRRVNDTSFVVTPEYCKEVRDGLNALKRKKVYQYTPDGKLVNVFESMREAIRNGFTRWKLNKCFSGEIDLYKGYRWSLDELEVV